MTAAIIGLVGSLRQGSYNRRLLNACVPLLAPSFTLEIHGLDGIPLYDGDAETRSGLPAAVTALKERIAPAAALLIASPEYTTAFPARSRTPSTGCRGRSATFRASLVAASSA